MKGLPTPAQRVDDRLDLERRATAADVDVMTPELSSLGWVEYKVAPSAIGEVKTLDFATLTSAVTGAAINLRGWDFPHIDTRSNISRKLDNDTATQYLAHRTDLERFVEAWVCTTRAFFCFRRILQEDLEGRVAMRNFHPDPPGTKFDWLLSLREIGELVAFAVRLFDKVGYTGEMDIVCSYSGMNGRLLAGGLDPIGQVMMRSRSRRCSQDSIRVAVHANVVDIRSDRAGTAIQLLQQLFGLFGWDADPGMMRNHLDTLFAGRS
jgi:hypothetical protein